MKAPTLHLMDTCLGSYTAELERLEAETLEGQLQALQEAVLDLRDAVLDTLAPLVTRIDRLLSWLVTRG